MSTDRQELDRLANNLEILFDLPECTITCDYREPGVCIPPAAVETILTQTRTMMKPREAGLPDWNVHCDYVVQLGSNGPPFAVHAQLQAIIAELVAIGTCFCVNTSENTIATTQRGADAIGSLIATKDSHAEEEGS